MILWLDAQLPPSIARWIQTTFGVEAHPVRDFGLRDAKDTEIFQEARTAQVVVMTKDHDFVELLERLGPPPRVLWVTCGNTSNTQLKEILVGSLPAALRLLEQGERLVEISDVIEQVSSPHKGRS